MIHFHIALPRARLLPWLLLLLLAVAGSPPAQAHAEGRLRLGNAPAGPYEISVWTNPDPVTTETPTHVSLLVLEPAAEGQSSQATVDGATVTVSAFLVADPATTVTAAASQGSDAEEPFYEAELRLPRGGAWRFDLTVDGPLGQGQTSFDADVAGAGLNWWLWLAAGLVVLGAGWLALRRYGRRARVRARAADPA